MSPFIPPNKENFANKKVFDYDPWIIANIEVVKKQKELLRQPSV